MEIDYEINFTDVYLFNSSYESCKYIDPIINPSNRHKNGVEQIIWTALLQYNQNNLDGSRALIGYNWSSYLLTFAAA